MNIFKKASKNKLEGKGYYCHKRSELWSNKDCGWNHLHLNYGIRRSERIQYLPIWNTSNNSSRKLLFGFWKLFLEIEYHRKNGFYSRKNHEKLPFKDKLSRFYRLAL